MACAPGRNWLQGGLEQRLAVVAGLGKDLLVFDDLKIVDAKLLAVANDFDRLEGAVSDVDAPGKTRGGHVHSS